MIREHLSRIDGQRAVYRATFSRFDGRTSHGYFVPTALFVNVRNVHGHEVCDHIWMRKGKQIDDLKLAPGDVIEFRATSKPYWSGYIDRHLNYGLKNPTNMVKLGEERTIGDLPLFAGIAA